MFDRFSEPARRTVFFARYEASQTRSLWIETEHLLLALLREDRTLKDRLPVGVSERIRQEVESHFPPDAAPVSTSVDIPLSSEARRVLVYGNEEAEALGQKIIDTGHLVLGLLRQDGGVGSTLLRPHGIDYASYREMLTRFPPAGGKRGSAARLTKGPGRPNEPNSDAPAGVANWLADLVNEAVPHLESFREEETAMHLKRGPWTRKEALGHLIDWAATHQQWIARALTEPKLVAALYPQEEWVAVQGYGDLPWKDLLELWAGLNRLLAHGIEQIPAEKWGIMCRIGIEEPIPLAKLVLHYLEHCGDIVGQILMRG